MRIHYFIILLLLQTSVSYGVVVLKGDNNTFRISHDTYEGFTVVEIHRAKGEFEKIKIPLGHKEAHDLDINLAAMNAFLTTGGGFETPEKFKDAAEFLKYARSKSQYVEDRVKDPFMRTYAFNLRLANTRTLNRAERCEYMIVRPEKGIAYRKAQDASSQEAGESPASGAASGSAPKGSGAR